MPKGISSHKAWQRLIIALAVGIIALVTAAPGMAASGVGTGEVGFWSDDGEDTGNQGQGCGGQVSNTSATWLEAGTWNTTDGTATGEFTGITQVTLTSTGDYNFGPVGSYDPTADCAPTPFPLPANPAGYAVGGTTVTVTSGLGVGGPITNCTLTGTFSRDLVAVVTVEVSGNCTVNSVTENIDVTFTLNVDANPVTGPPYPIVGVLYQVS